MSAAARTRDERARSGCTATPAAELRGRSDQTEQTGRVEPIFHERCGNVLIVTLNRPGALNSLTLEMVDGLHAVLDMAEADKEISAILLQGAGSRGLCAGGDIKQIYESGKAGTSLAIRFWRREFELNARIARLSKPYIAVMDGIVMGGGVGVSAHGSHRIVTDRSRIAMPETGIGYFPDVGGSFLLSRHSGQIGTYLALAGDTVGATEAITAGLADYLVPCRRLSELYEALCSIPMPDAHSIHQTVRAFRDPGNDCDLCRHGQVIDRAFGFDTVQKILSALDDEPDAFASRAAAVLRSRSPNSLKLTLRMLRLARQMESIEECLEMEFHAAVNILGEHDFYEGIRAAVIDKDRKPIWTPSSIEDVADEHIERFFTSSEPPLFP